MWVTQLVRPSLQDNSPPIPATEAAPPPAMDVGSAVQLRGTVTGSGDLSIDGEIDGTIALPGLCVTLGAHARVSASIGARRVRIAGRLVGDVTATEAVEVTATGSVTGDILAPAVAIADGARFTGSIDMRAQNPERAAADVTAIAMRQSIALAG